MKIKDIFENNEIPTNPSNAYNYAADYYDRTGERCYEAEPIILEYVGWAYTYALKIIKDRWPEAEHIFMQSPYAHGYCTKLMIPSVLKSNPNSKQIFRLLMDITKYFNKDKVEYDDLIKQVFPDSSIMVDKWINYGNNQRDKK